MTSKHYRWQLRWREDPAAGLLVHNTGLQVRVSGGQSEALNESAIMPALIARNGGHNAPIMLQRLLREAFQLHGDARGVHRG